MTKKRTIDTQGAEYIFDDNYGNGDEYQFVQKTFDRHSRWGLSWIVIAQRVNTDEFYSFTWELAATEMQESPMWAYPVDIELTRVYPTQTTVTIYKETADE